VEHPAIARLRAAVKSRPGVPVSWHSSIGVLFGLVIAAGLGQLLDLVDGGKTVPVSCIAGMFLGLVAVMGPFFMSLRLVIAVGLLMTLTSGLAVVAGQHPWLAVAGMVVLVFVGTVWTSIPLVGSMIGNFPIIGFLLILAKGQAFTGGAAAGRVMLATVAGLIAALIVLVVFSGRDPRGPTRGLVAKAWGPLATSRQQGSMLGVLRLDSAPRALITVGQAAILAMIARSWLEAEKDTDAYRAGIEAQAAISSALLPRGPIVGRTVTPSVDDARAPRRLVDGKALRAGARTSLRKDREGRQRPDRVPGDREEHGRSRGCDAGDEPPAVRLEVVGEVATSRLLTHDRPLRTQMDRQ